MAGRRPTRPSTRTRKPARAPARKRAGTASTRRRVAGARTTAARAVGTRAPRAGAPFRVLLTHLAYSSHDVAGMRRFYTETLGFGDFSVDQDHQYLSVRTGPGSSLGFMPPLPGPPEQWRPPREPAIHLVVDDVDRAHRVLSARGVTFEQAPADRPWGYRTAVLRDPEGRLLCLAQPIPRGRT